MSKDATVVDPDDPDLVPYQLQKNNVVVSLGSKLELKPWDQFTPVIVTLAEGLLRNNFCVYDGLLGRTEALALRHEVAGYYKGGRMIDGQIGTGNDAGKGHTDEKLRTDKVVWLEGGESFCNKMKTHTLRMDVLVNKLAIFLECIADDHINWKLGHPHRSKIMATCYPGSGARYKPHYDNPNKNGRKLTAIVYLNDGWKVTDGGVLRVKTKGQTVNVAPLLDRLIVFWSDKRVPHEVLPATGTDRFAVTIWYMDEQERQEAVRNNIKPLVHQEPEPVGPSPCCGGEH